MDYEKKYKEALKDMRAIYPNLKGDAKLAVEHAFPELAESGNGWFIKELQGFLESYGADYFGTGEWQKFNDWLEKQKEQKKDNPLEDFSRGYNAGYYHGITDSEQKPAQTETEKQYVRTLKSLVSDFIRDRNPEDVPYYQGIFDWLDGRHIEQKPAEWSEEDEKIRRNLISLLANMRGDRITEETYQKYYPCLKDLRSHWKPSKQEKGALRTAIHVLTKERNFPKTAAQLQNILDAFEGKESRKDWKPSEEQIKALYCALNDAISLYSDKVSPLYEEISRTHFDALESLYNDLKKLM